EHAASRSPFFSDDDLPHAGTILARIKRPESEVALLRLFDREGDPGGQVELGMCLCILCTTAPEALERIQRIVDDADAFRRTSSSWTFEQSDVLASLGPSLLATRRMVGL